MNQNGFALVFVLLVLAAVELLTLSTLSLATHEAVIAEVQLKTATAGRDAEAALAQLAADWPIRMLDSLQIGETRSLPAVHGAALSVRRTSWGSYYANAVAPAGSGVVQRQAVLRRLDIERAMTEANEAIASAGQLIATNSTISIDSTACSLPFALERPPAPVTVATRHDAPGVRDARVDSAHAVLPGGYALGGVRSSEIPSLADVQATGTVQLPIDTTGIQYPLIYAPGDLKIDGGAGSGLLFVAGNLQITGGAIFTGLIVTGGTAQFSDGASLLGALRIHGNRTSILTSARITHSRCALARVLQETPSAARLIKTHRFYIPAF